MSTLTAIQEHYANLLHDHAQHHGCSMKESARKLDTSLLIEITCNDEDDEYYDPEDTFDIFDANGDLICQVESTELTKYAEADGYPSDSFRTNLETFTDCLLEELVDLNENSQPVSASRILKIIAQFEQHIKDEKVTYAAEIAARTRRFAPGISTKKVGGEWQLTCDMYLYNADIPGAGHAPVCWRFKPSEEVMQFLKNNQFASGHLGAFRELLEAASRLDKLRALVAV